MFLNYYYFLELLQENLNELRNENAKSHNISKCIRMQGTPEDPKKTNGETLVPTNNEVNNLLDSIGANVNFTEIQRPGKFRNDR